MTRGMVLLGGNVEGMVLDALFLGSCAIVTRPAAEQHVLIAPTSKENASSHVEIYTYRLIFMVHNVVIEPVL